MPVAERPRYLRTFLLTLLLCLAGPAFIVAVIDPYQVWHDPWLRADAYSENQRYQNAGLIRRFLECDTCEPAAVVVGTSLSENMSTEDIRVTTGMSNAVRLLAKGSKPVEHWHMLSRALASGNVQIVYWEVYRNFVREDYDQTPSSQVFPRYLYTPSLYDDFPYLLNHTNFGNALELLLGLSDWSSVPDTLNSWHAEALENKRYKNWNDASMVSMATDRVAPRIAKWGDTEPQWDTPVPVYERYILPLVDAYPDVQFVFFYPPVSLIRHGEDIEGTLSGQLVLRLKLASLAAERANVEVFMFDDYKPIVTDMAYYKDPGHYMKGVDKWMLERMQADDERFVLRPETARKRLQLLWDDVVLHLPRSSCVATPAYCGRLQDAVLGADAL